MRVLKTAPMLLVLALLAAGCASTGGSGSSGDRDLLSREQFAGLEHLTAFEVVQRKKPTWLRTNRGQDSFATQGQRGLRVYLDGVFFGDVESLRNIQARDVQELRFLDKREATLRFGTNHAEGAILVSTHR